MPKFEIGRIFNLGGNQEQEQEVLERNPIGFKPAERRSEEPSKLDKIGFPNAPKETLQKEENNRE